VVTPGTGRPEIRKPDPGQLTDGQWFLLVGRGEPGFADQDLPEDESGDPLPAGGCQGEPSGR